MKTDMQAIAEIEHALEQILLGRGHKVELDIDTYPAYYHVTLQKLISLIENMRDANRFAVDIASGRLQVTPPGRRNFLAGPLKEIHSQLISFCYSIEQLIKGNMVAKLYYPGELFESYNALIDKVSQTFSNLEAKSPEWGDSVSSWRYHQLLSAINQLHIMVLEVDTQGTILFANPPVKEAFPNIYALPYGRPITQDEGELLAYLCTFSKYSDAELEKIQSDEFPVFTELYDPAAKAWYKITSDRVPLADGSMGILHMIDDISEWKNHEYELRRTATLDPLTSAYTRKAGLQKLDELLWKRWEEQHCIAFLDIDDLKLINDIYGHSEGDFAIRSISETITASLRKTDWVVRYGGDEFVVLFIDCDEAFARECIERMRARLDMLNAQLDKPYKLGFSVGLAPIEPTTTDQTELIALVDKRMYEDKQCRKLNA